MKDMVVNKICTLHKYVALANRLIVYLYAVFWDLFYMSCMEETKNTLDMSNQLQWFEKVDTENETFAPSEQTDIPPYS